MRDSGSPLAEGRRTEDESFPLSPGKQGPICKVFLDLEHGARGGSSRRGIDSLVEETTRLVDSSEGGRDGGGEDRGVPDARVRRTRPGGVLYEDGLT